VIINIVTITLTKKYGDTEMPKLKNALETPDDGADRQEPTPYHGATFNAFRYRLRNYSDDQITITDEHRLSKEPLRIDITIIKKKRDIELEPAWAKIFRGHNIIEYKSPVDAPPTPDVFDKLIGYARIYAAQEKVKISDMTATLICAAPPEKLFKILEDEFYYEILPKDDGIYYIVQKGVPVEKTLAIQLATYKSEPLLQALDKKPLDEATVDKVAESIAAAVDELGYWCGAVATKNLENIFERMKDMKTNDDVIMDFIESKGISDRIRQKGRQEGRQEGLQEGLQKGAQEVISLLEKGYSPDDIKKMMQLA
jgi:hypothetical protein